MTPSLAPIAAPLTTAPSTDRQQLAKAARQFEAIFVRQMLSQARKADFGGDLLGGQGLDTFRTMQDERFADIAAETGAFGMARMIELQLAQQVAPQTPLPPAGGVGGGPVPTSTPATVTNPPLAPPAGGRGTGGPALPGREF